MRIETSCPSCHTLHFFDEVSRGRQIRCKKCDEVFVVGKAKKGSARSDAEPEDPDDRVQTSPRSGPPLPRRRPEDDDDDDEDYPRRKRRPRQQSQAGTWIIVGAVVLVVVLVGVALIAVTWSQSGDQVAANPVNPNDPGVNDPNQGNVPAGPLGVEPAPNIPAGPMGVKPPPIIPAADELAQKLADLQSPNVFVRGPAADWLAQVDPNVPKRAAVAKELEKLLATAPAHETGVAKALMNWATKDQTPALIKLVQNTTFTVWDNERRALAMATLGKLKDERGAEAIAKRLPDFFDRGHASKALKDMGPVAEKAVVPILSAPDVFTRIEACHVLAVIGTRKVGIPAINQALALDANNGLLRMAALDAVKAINARGR